MTEWRVRGFVGDSDDEDGSIDLDNESTHDNGGRDSREQQDNIGEETVRDEKESSIYAGASVRVGVSNRASPSHNDPVASPPVHSAQPSSTVLGPTETTRVAADGGIDFDNVLISNKDHLFGSESSSSPLSEPPATPELEAEKEVSSSQSDLPDLLDLLSRHQTTRAAPVVDSDLALASSANQEAHARTGNEAGRIFRRRNPIQLHPYLLEGEQYRQAFRARGLRPVVVESQRDIARDVQDQIQPGDDIPYYSPAASQNSSQSLYDSSPPVVQTLSPRHSANLEEEEADEEFPDLASLLRRSAAGELQVGYKRRRINGPNLLDLRQTERDVFEGPQYHSHIATQGRPKKLRFRKFKVPRGVTPISLPTPVTSSELGTAQSDLFEEELAPDQGSESDQEEHAKLYQSPAATRKTPISVDSSSNSSEEDVLEIKRAQKKTRGVLPASWARLDLNAQTGHVKVKQRNLSRLLSPSKPLQQRGVAQRVSHGQIHAPNSPAKLYDPADLFSSSDDSDDPAVIVPLNRPASASRRSSEGVRPINIIHHIEDDTQDIVEEDWVDPMIPPRSRNRKQGENPRHYQTRLPATLRPARNQATSNSRSRSSKSRKLQTRIQVRTYPPKTRSVVWHRSVLDATQPWSATSLPNFVKIATRRARSRKDKSRHSPSNKFISLQDIEDQEDVNEVLRDWRAGAIERQGGWSSPSKSKAITYRHPLKEQAVNQQQRPPSPTKRIHVQKTVRDILRNETSERKRAIHLPRYSQESHTLNQEEYVTGDISNKTVDISSRKLQRPSVRPRPLRTAQLEDLQEEHDIAHPEAAFQRNLSRLNRRFDEQADRSNVVPRPLVARLLSRTEISIPIGVQSDVASRSPSAMPQEGQAVPIHRRRKRCPRKLVSRPTRLLVELDDKPVFNEIISLPQNTGIGNSSILDDIERFGSSYSIDLGVQNLPPDTHFHGSTILGSGLLRDALELQSKDLSVPSSTTSFTYRKISMRWGAWNEDVSSQLKSLCQEIRSDILSALDSMESTALMPEENELFEVFVPVIQYFSKSLCYTDAIDRRSFVAQSLGLLKMLFDDLDTISCKVRQDSEASIQIARHQLRLQCGTHLAILVSQVLQIASDPLVEIARKRELQLLMGRVAEFIFRNILINGTSSVREILHKFELQSTRDSGMRQDDVEIQSVVVLAHLLDKASIPGYRFWEIVNTIFSESLTSASFSLRSMEEVWRDIFSLLPILRFDSIGRLRPDSYLECMKGDWGLIKTMWSHVIQAYSTNPNPKSTMANTYIRATLSRCHHLLRTWTWQKCEPIMNAVFDFFAHNGLAMLKGEESRGSPVFLENLCEDVVPDTYPDDRSFHIFLKILARGLMGMREIYSDKKIRSIAWRFIPNHGRLYKKDEDLKQTDLDALRNHHDLLCVLYWASPASCRPKLELIRNLVDFGASHLEACRLNVRAWANLARFQTSTSESTQEFSLWLNNILNSLILQHRLAKTEAEEFYNATNASVSRNLLQSVITSNQRQIEALIAATLSSLRDIIDHSRDSEPAFELFRNCPMAEVFRLFETTLPRIQSIIALALDVQLSYVSRMERTTDPNSTQQQSEDSQDYGDWPMFDDIAIEQSPDLSATILFDEAMLGPLFQLLSNVFGADIASDDTFLSKLVKTWVIIARRLVRQGRREWTQYLDPYSQYSWQQLRDTEQTRKYAAYFLSAIIETDQKAYHEHSQAFLTAWMATLVERDSMLKYQHRLTNSMINTDPESAIFQNLPFTRKPGVKTYDITLDELRERRLSLLSSILSNMRDVFESAFTNSRNAEQDVRQNLASMLKALMGSMKKIFLDTQLGSSTRGSYVYFAQSVVEFLQQYTTDICPIERFFTESTAFPLPADDPLYIVGRLKSYGVIFVNTKNQKQLAVFLQTISERAAVSSQQNYLAEQLYKAISGSFESSTQSRPSLRRVALQAIFPAYIESALRSDCSWIMAIPILEASKCIFTDHLYQFSITDATSAAATRDLLYSFCNALRLCVGPVLITPESLLETHVLAIVSRIFDAVASLLGLVSYLRRSNYSMDGPVEDILFFEELAERLRGQLKAQPNTWDPPEAFSEREDEVALPELRAFCFKELKDSAACWSKHGNEYYLSRGNNRRQISVELGSMQEERGVLLNAVDSFLTSFASIFGEAANKRFQQQNLAIGLDLLV